MRTLCGNQDDGCVYVGATYKTLAAGETDENGSGDTEKGSESERESPTFTASPPN